MATCTGIARRRTMTAADTEPRKRESPNSAAAWDKAIGFRVHAYGPTVTRAIGGIVGFGVPRPTRPKRAKHHASPAMPRNRKTSPSHRTGAGHGGSPRNPSTVSPTHGIPA